MCLIKLPPQVNSGQKVNEANQKKEAKRKHIPYSDVIIIIKYNLPLMYKQGSLSHSQLSLQLRCNIVLYFDYKLPRFCLCNS